MDEYTSDCLIRIRKLLLRLNLEVYLTLSPYFPLLLVSLFRPFHATAPHSKVICFSRSVSLLLTRSLDGTARIFQIEGATFKRTVVLVDFFLIWLQAFSIDHTSYALAIAKASPDGSRCDVTRAPREIRSELETSGHGQMN